MLKLFSRQTFAKVPICDVRGSFGWNQKQHNTGKESKALVSKRETIQRYDENQWNLYNSITRMGTQMLMNLVSRRAIHSQSRFNGANKHHEFLSLLHPNTPRSFPPEEGSEPPSSFAVVHVGGHQYKVTIGDIIVTEKLEAAVASTIILNKVLLLGTKTFTRIGSPLLDDVTVHAVVEEQTKTEKTIIFKKRRRKHYRRLRGHRQPVTTLRITDILFQQPQQCIINYDDDNIIISKN